MNFQARIERFLFQPMLIDIKFGLSAYAEYASNIMLADGNKTMIKEMLRQRDALAVVDVLEGGMVKHNSIIDAAPNSIVSVPLKGTMFAEDGLCTMGIDHTCRQIELAATNPNIRGIILKTHSGGGEVTAAQRLSNTISEARQSKPIIQFIDGLSASGAVFAGVQCDEVIAGGPTVETGSIGVVIQLDKEMIAWMKESILSIYADQSSDKHDFMKALMDGDFDRIRKNHLNPIAIQFQKLVRSRRSNVKEESLTGHTYLAGEAKKMGLVDSIGTFQDAVKRVNHLAKNRNRKNSARRAMQEIKFK